MHEAVLTYDSQLVRQAMRAYWWRVVGLRFIVGTALIAISLGFAIARGDTSWVTGVLASVLVLGIAFVVAIYVIPYRRAIRKLTEMRGPHATLQASDSALSMSSGAGSATLPWSAVIEVWQFRTFWLLFFSKAQFVTVPLANVAPETAAFILARVKASGGKVS